MDSSIETMLDKVWIKMPIWKAHKLNEEEVTDEVYKIYHGADRGAPKKSTEQGAYDCVVAQLEAAVNEKDAGLHIKQEHDHVFVNLTPPSESASNTEWRVYLNIKAADLERVGFFILNDIFPLRLAGGFKVASDAGEADHFDDSLVIYTTSAGNCRAIIRRIEAAPSNILTGLGKPPMMTKVIPNTKIGIGESPKDSKVSFGKLRAAAIAKAVVSYWASEQPGRSVKENRKFMSWLAEEALRLIGVDTNAGFRNLGSQTKKVDLKAYRKTSLESQIMSRAFKTP